MKAVFVFFHITGKYSGIQDSKLAEDYHQKHSLRSYPEILEEFRAMFPEMKNLINSTVVTRING